MNADQAFQYLNIPWGKDAQGPDAFNCWYLTAHIERKYFGKEMPELDVLDQDQVLATYNQNVKTGYWSTTKYPIHGDVALLKSGANPHVGVFLDIDGGGVLHSQEGVGVVFTPLQALRTLGYGRTVYYRISDGPPRTD